MYLFVIWLHGPLNPKPLYSPLEEPLKYESLKVGHMDP